MLSKKMAVSLTSLITITCPGSHGDSRHWQVNLMLSSMPMISAYADGVHIQRPVGSERQDSVDGCM